jgi:hypothetical protein
LSAARPGLQATIRPRNTTVHQHLFTDRLATGVQEVPLAKLIVVERRPGVK